MVLSIFNDIVIVGVAESDIGETPKYNAIDLMGQAAYRALKDAGLKKDDVDGLFSTSAYYQMPTLTLAEYMGISPNFMDGTNIGGSSFLSQIGHAALAIKSGLCEVALIAYGSTQRTDRGGFVSSTEPFSYEDPFGHLYPITSYALATQRHMHEFGTTRKQLSEVAVSTRKWASMNKRAFKRDLLSISEVSESTLISSPLRKLDCCLVTDGGAAIIITTKERAKRLNRKPIFIWGYGESTSHRRITSMPDLTTTSATLSGKKAYEMAGVSPEDMDFLQLYDAFTINVIMFLEDLGFCKKGEGGKYVESGNIAPGGKMPVNTNGGGLSYCHPGMNGLFLIVEAVRQLRKEVGDARQVNNPKLSLVHGNGGTFSSQVTTILSSESK